MAPDSFACPFCSMAITRGELVQHISSEGIVGCATIYTCRSCEREVEFEVECVPEFRLIEPAKRR